MKSSVIVLVVSMSLVGCGKMIKGLNLCESQPDKGGLVCLSTKGVPAVIPYNQTGGYKCLNQAGYVGALKEAKVTEDQLIRSLKLRTE